MGRAVTTVAVFAMAGLLASAAAPPSLKDLAPSGLLIGAAVNRAQSDGKDAPAVAIVTRQLNSISPENLLKAMLTELDIDVLPRDPEMWGADLAKKARIKAASNLYPDGLPAQKQQELARRYADIFALVLRHRRTVSRVTLWGVTDAQSWLHDFPIPGRVNYPLLWDREARPKPAFQAVVDVLSRREKE